MGDLLSKYQPGDIIYYQIENNFWGKALSLKHYGVVIDGGYVISKYEENGGQLEKHKIGTASWINITLLKKGGRKCADHAIARYEKGKINCEGHREDICPYSAISSNCQNFANDCFIQKDLTGSSEDSHKVADMVIDVFSALGFNRVKDMKDEIKRKAFSIN